MLDDGTIPFTGQKKSKFCVQVFYIKLMEYKLNILNDGPSAILIKQQFNKFETPASTLNICHLRRQQISLTEDNIEHMRESDVVNG